ncbi:MAG: hypothetical protein QOC99_11 [Acidobacteriota bacterium]|jgi:hypothetical protein|nr:hypothetical protein [Acidobacteriota bacterium]
MRREFRTLLRSISTFAVLLTLVLGTSLGVSAKGHGHRLGRHDNGRHLGWTKGRHLGWSHSRHSGVGTNNNLGSNRRSNRDVLTRRDDNRRDRGIDMSGHGMDVSGHGHGHAHGRH